MCDCSMFHQDDAHIFCTHEQVLLLHTVFDCDGLCLTMWVQIQQEIAGCLQMLEHSYR